MIDYYVQQSKITDPGVYAHYFDCLPRSVRQLCNVAQGLILHLHDAPAMGYEIPKARLAEIELRSMSKLLAQLLQIGRAHV